MSYLKEIKKRKTFAIISHPDAGKTTLTEKLLLYSGAIQIAGAVKSNKIRKTAASDFLEIEKQRGISVATSVLSFNYNKQKINLLDTPGHKDFAEDTFRTSTAVNVLNVSSAKSLWPGVSNIFTLTPLYSNARTEVATEIPRWRSISIKSLVAPFFILLLFTAPAS